MNPEALRGWLDCLAGVRVAVVGDVMVDRFVYGDVHRVSAEAPVPVLAHVRENVMLGGAGNVARNVAAAGGMACLVGILGDDAPGREALQLLELEAGVEPYLIPDHDRPTTVKTRFSSGSHQMLRLDTEATSPIEGQVEARVVAAIVAATRGCGAILLSDYGKGVVTPAVIAACAAAPEALLIVDSKARGFSRYGSADVVKPNASELARATDLPTETDGEIEEALSAALASCAARAILVTRAAKGMSLAVRGEPVRHFSRPPPEVFDTAGAGDTALALTGLALAAGADLPTAVEIALMACAVVVQKAGVATVSAEEMMEAAAAADRTPRHDKVVGLPGMVAEVTRWRSQGLKVGFTNGCFDILHPGHVTYLAQARSWCDRLIVGLNSDASVRAAKGAGRPVNDLASRAAVLAALSCVDAVVAFDEETPIRLIEAARPDLLVKGGDYAPDQVVGADFVHSYGGEVRLATFVDGHSTTATLRRAAEG